MDLPTLNTNRDATLSNAESLIRAAQLLRGQDLEHVRFHLGVISLEEIGKAELISMRYIADVKGEEDTPFGEYLDDHVKKQSSKPGQSVFA